MKMMYRLLTVVLVLGGAVAHGGLELGQAAPGFVLPDADGSFHALNELKGEKATAVIFTCNHCPVAKAYQERIIDLQKRYMDKGVRVLGINVNDAGSFPADGFEEMKKRAADKGYNFRYLRDRTQETAAAYGAVCTPHVFLLDGELRLRYEGRIDDSWNDPAKVKSRDLAAALDALVAGTAVENARTLAQGCSIKWTRPGEDPATPFSTADSPESVKPLDVGTRIPDALVSDLDGKAVWLRERVEGKPTALIVFRGGWCFHCKKHFRALGGVLPELRELGYRVIAISPDTPTGTTDGLKDLDLDYELLSDLTMEAALAMGLAFRLDPATIKTYVEKYKIPLRSPPGREDSVLPVPAVFLLDAKGVVRYSHTNPDYKRRLDPRELLAEAKKHR